MTVSYWVTDALSTTRAPLDLMHLEASFTQLALLSADDFVRQAQRRDIGLHVGQLEELHRLKILVPLFRIDLTPRPSNRRFDKAQIVPQSGAGYSTIFTEMVAAAVDQRLADPIEVGFSPWPRVRMRTLWPSFETGYLYSQHQLLQLAAARSIIDEFVLVSRSGEGLSWQLPEDRIPDKQALSRLASWRSLAVILSSLDTALWPDVTNVVKNDFSTWLATRSKFSVLHVLDWLAVTPDAMQDQADWLLSAAAHDDTLGDFYDVVRRAEPSTWKSLRGAARISMDQRMAAELLWLALDQLGVVGAPIEKVPVSRQRLTARVDSLDSVLTRLRISPFPALVVALEGETEMRIIPRVFELLGMRQDPSWIVLENLGGTDSNPRLLARYAAKPMIGKDLGDYVTLDRPVTRFFLVTDAENKYRRERGRKKWEERLLDCILEGLAPDLQADLRRPEVELVEIGTWGDLPFEFAHFSDIELADALLEASPRGYDGGRGELAREILLQRSAESPDILRAWLASGVRKPQLADVLWPLLQSKIERSLEAGDLNVPVLRAVVRMEELARKDYGKSIVVKKGVPHAPTRP